MSNQLQQIAGRLFGADRATEIAKATRLRNLRIDEVSSVDKGAGEGVRLVLMKRESKSKKKPKKNRVPNAVSADNEVDMGKGKISTLAKAAIATGATTVEKSVFYAKIAKRTAKLRKDGESFERAFTRVILEDEKARTLFKAMQLAPGSDVSPDAARAAPVQKFASPAHERMDALAKEMQQENLSLSYASAYAKVYTDPANIGLRDEIKKAEIGASLRHQMGQAG